MRNDNDQKTSLILAVCGILPIVWFALLTAPYVDGGLVEIIENLPIAMNNPFHITVCEDSVKTVLLFLLAYGMGIGIYLSTRKNYRRREEHGSAKWGNAGAINKKYQDKNPSANKLLTQNVRIGLDGKKHRRNLNILCCGGSGAGKTRFFCKPNAMQCNTSMVVLDPKGEIVRDVGGLLEKKGYEVRVLDLINMHKSHCYNPFVYLKNDNDVQRLVTNLFKATTPKGSQSQDPFWDTAASMLLLSLVFYLKYEAPKDEQNFPMVMELLRAGEVHEDDDSYISPLDELFDRLEMENPDHIAVKYYKDYHSGSAKTLKSIQITLAARLEKFNLESVAALTATDELDLPSLGEKKVALFALIPDNDTSFNFLVSILYTQIFQQLFYLADHKYGGIPKDKKGNYCGNKIDAKLLVEINKNYPKMMREKGWDIEDLDCTDWDRCKTDEAYRNERKSKRKSGKSVNNYIADKMREQIQENESMSEIMCSAILDALEVTEEKDRLDALKEQIEADKAILKAEREQLEKDKGKLFKEMLLQEKKEKEFQHREDMLEAQRNALEQERKDIQKKSDKDLLCYKLAYKKECDRRMQNYKSECEEAVQEISDYASSLPPLSEDVEKVLDYASVQESGRNYRTPARKYLQTIQNIRQSTIKTYREIPDIPKDDSQTGYDMYLGG